MSTGAVPHKTWSEYQDWCFAKVLKDLRIFNSKTRPASKKDYIIEHMAGAVLAAINYDALRFTTMYEVLKFVEDDSFWDDVVFMYENHTGNNIPFISEDDIRLHAEAVETVYKEHGLHNMEALLLEEH